MNENQIISKIKLLKQIKPDKDWVVFTKNQILKEKQGFSFSFKELFSYFSLKIFQPAVIIPALLILVIAGFLIFANNLPEQPKLAQSPIEQAKVITPAIEELHLAIAQTTEELKKIETENPEKILEINKAVTSVISESELIISKSQELVKDIELEIDKGINDDAQQEGQILATQLESFQNTVTKIRDYHNQSMARAVEREINNLRDRSLTEEQEQLLEQAEQYFQQGQYNQALQLLLLEI